MLLDEPTSQLDPVAGDELIGLLRRLNEDFDTAIVLAEHRLERCLARRRPGDRARATDGRLRRAAGRVPGLGATRGPGAADARRAAARAASGSRRCRGVKRARAALRAHGPAAGPVDADRDAVQPAAAEQPG